MENVNETYTNFHKTKSSEHIYPTEWVIRTLLGTYPRLALKKETYKGAKILDQGFGDCRNMPLISNCGFDVFGVEISQDIVELGRSKLKQLGIEATLEVGTNTSIPFENSFFDYLLSCFSCYYVDKESTFTNNLKEMVRVIKPGGVLIASLPAPGNFILKDAIPIGDGHVTITNDIFNLRNGYTFRTFADEMDVLSTFEPFFENVTVCKCEDDFWGLQINYFIIVGEKK